MKKRIYSLVSFAFLIIVFLVLYKIYIPRINAFGCFDDCFNIMGGYFINNGYAIFKDFFFNHQPAMAYISAFVQFVSNPTSIAELILRHRQIIFLISLLFSCLLFIRFGKKMILPIVLYEFSKFYFFGDRFLAESITPYFVIYQLASIFELYTTKKIKKIDTYLVPLFFYAIILLREPYLLATLFLFGTYLFLIFKNNKKRAVISFSILIAVTILTILLNSPTDYFYNVVTVNQGILTSDALNQNIYLKFLKIFFYPFYLVVSPLPWTILRTFTFLITASFTLGTIFLFFILKKRKEVLFILVFLFLVNLRPSPANVLFYEAFNLAVWMYSFITITFLLGYYCYKKSKKLGTAVFILLFFALIALVTNKGYFAYEKFVTHEEFFINYSYVMDVGTKIRELSTQGDTLFVDGYDDLILWESKLPSSYKYLWFTSSMPKFEKYIKARNEMFLHYPPQFYYGLCPDEENPKKDLVSSILKKDYVNISPEKDRGCIMILKTKLPKISAAQKQTLINTKYIMWD